MADLKQEVGGLSPANADHYLDYLNREWQDVPSVAREWHDWTDLERLTFAVEWPLREDRLTMLLRWYTSDRLTLKQRESVKQLLALIECHRPTLERLLTD